MAGYRETLSRPTDLRTTIDPRSWLTADERGSIVAIADDSGTVTAINTYDEFGKPGASNIGTFQYTGQAWLPELGLYYYKARFYAPHLGRFMQTDPIGYGGDGPNLYAYVLNDPVNYVDPLGLDSQDPIEVVGSPWPFGHSGTFVGTSGAGTGSRLGPPCTTCIMVIAPHPQYPAVPEDELLPGDCTICNATVTGNLNVGVVITARRTDRPFVVENGRFVYSGYQKSFWSNEFDACFVFCPPAIAGIAAVAITGWEFTIGINWRIALLGNRGPGRFKWPHYHRRGMGPDNEPAPGQGIKRHRPWESKSTDTSWRDRF